MCIKAGTAFFFAGHAVYIAAIIIAGSRVYMAGLMIVTGASEFTKLLAAVAFIFMISDILYILTQFGRTRRSWYNAANLIT